MHHWLRHHPHLRAYFASHPRSKEHFIDVCNHYPVKMAHNLSMNPYCHWLYHWLLNYHHLPGIDLLLGA